LFDRQKVTFAKEKSYTTAFTEAQCLRQIIANEENDSDFKNAIFQSSKQSSEVFEQNDSKINKL